MILSTLELFGMLYVCVLLWFIVRKQEKKTLLATLITTGVHAT